MTITAEPMTDAEILYYCRAPYACLGQCDYEHSCVCDALRSCQHWPAKEVALPPEFVVARKQEAR